MNSFSHTHTKRTTQTTVPSHLAMKKINKNHRPDLQKLIGRGSGVERMRGWESQKSGRRHQRESSPAVTCSSTPAGTPNTHLHGPHQLFCWSSPKRARHFFGALRSEVTKKGRGSQWRRDEIRKESGKRDKLNPMNLTSSKKVFFPLHINLNSSNWPYFVSNTNN